MAKDLRKDLRADFTSRQYMTSRDYEIFYYSDLHFTPTTAHSHQYYEFYFFVKGDIEFIIRNEERVRLETGDMVLMPPGVEHYARAIDPEKPYQRFVFWISKEYYEIFMHVSSDFGYIFRQAAEGRYVYHFDPITFNAFQTSLFEIIQETHQDRYGKSTNVNLLISLFLFNINRSVHEKDFPPKIRESATLHQNLIFYIENHLTDQISLDDLAREFYLSKYYLVHLFRENTGLSPHQYILKKRLNLFKDSLRENGDILSTCSLCGFTDYSSFFRAFKKEFGISPSEYLQQITRESAKVMQPQKPKG